jgi:hypothetical protein
MATAGGRHLAGGLLLIAGLLDWLGMHAGAAKPNYAVLVVAGLLLFGVWRGIRWCRSLILYLAAGAGGVWLCVAIPALFGAHGVVAGQLFGLTLFVVSGVLLATRPVAQLVA